MNNKAIQKALSLLRYTAAGAIVGSALAGIFFSQVSTPVEYMDAKSWGALLGAVAFLIVAMKFDFK